jgi:protoporphyrinogen oxidase
MKIRIKGNSVRIRLSRSETQQLAETSRIEECTQFVNGTFSYVLLASEAHTHLDAHLGDNTITVLMPAQLTSNWFANDVVGYDHHVALPDGGQLYLLIEKDFKCIDNSMGEDQSDNYENPSKIC